MLSRSPKLRLAVMSLAPFAIVIAVAYALSTRFELPNYGAWTGIQPLETKISMLKEFADRGDVDALVLGSSIVDFGFDAQLFSELMSRELGKEYRAFNFATGGARLRTLPRLYRLARTVSRPRNVLVMVPVEKKLDEDLNPNSPDFSLQSAPVSEVIDHRYMLWLSRFVRDLPLLRNASAVRDLALYGDFRHLQSKIGMESYAVDGHGDRLSYLMTWKAEELPMWRRRFEQAVLSYPYDGNDLEKKAEFYLADRDIKALRELRRLVEADGGKLNVLAHGAAATVWEGVEATIEYAQIRRDFLEALSALAGVKALDPVDGLSVPTYAVSDTTHLNTYGAQAYTRAAFSTFTGKSARLVEDRMTPPPEMLFPTEDKSFNPLSALIRRPPGESHQLLHFRMVNTRAVPPIPPGDLIVALRTPDNRDIIATAAELAPSDYVAEVNLPPAAEAEGYVLRLVTGSKTEPTALGNPVADYEWLTSAPKLTDRLRPPGNLQLYALPPARGAGETMHIALASSKSMPPMLEFRLLLVGATAGDGLSLGRMAPTSGLMRVPVPTTIEDGTYVLQARDAVSNVPLLTSNPIRLTAMEEPIEVQVALPARVGDGRVTVRWSGVRKGSLQDWVGLFPAGGKEDARIAFQFTDGKRASSLSFVVPASVGQKLDIDYDFRLFAQGGWRLLGKSEPFRFEARRSSAEVAATAASSTQGAAANTARVEVDPGSVIGDGTLRVKWSGIAKPNPQDWVGLFPLNGDDVTRLAFMFLPGTPEGQVSFNIPANLASRIATGGYEMRLYAAGRRDLLARSGRITLTAAPPVKKGK